MTVALIILGIITFMLHWWLIWIPLLAYISFFRAAWFVVPVAFVLDGYYGNFYAIPWLTISAVAWHLFVVFMRPRLLEEN